MFTSLFGSWKVGLVVFEPGGAGSSLGSSFIIKKIIKKIIEKDY
jgi:hypothetical protein